VTTTFAFGLNDKGQVVGSYTNAPADIADGKLSACLGSCSSPAAG
jgi:hypothetical protein